jgi:hypothetical protein
MYPPAERNWRWQGNRAHPAADWQRKLRTAYVVPRLFVATELLTFLQPVDHRCRSPMGLKPTPSYLLIMTRLRNYSISKIIISIAHPRARQSSVISSRHLAAGETTRFGRDGLPTSSAVRHGAWSSNRATSKLVRGARRSAHHARTGGPLGNRWSKICDPKEAISRLSCRRRYDSPTFPRQTFAVGSFQPTGEQIFYKCEEDHTRSASRALRNG